MSYRSKSIENLKALGEVCSVTPLESPLPRHTNRSVSSLSHIPQPIYLGVEVEVLMAEGKVNFAVCTHDGSYTLDYYTDSVDVSKVQPDMAKILMVEDIIVKQIEDYQLCQNYKVHAIGLGLRLCDEKNQCTDYGKERVKDIYNQESWPSLGARLWLQLDALPFILRSHGYSIDERASSAVRKTVVWLSPQYPGNITRVPVGYRNEVQVDSDSYIHLVDLAHYRESCTPQTWGVLKTLSRTIIDKRLRISFFNSTPQGGGVALMRHALLRLCDRLGMDVHWYVTTPSPEVFSITKRKFHNVLQGVAPDDTRLTEEEKSKFLKWTKLNAEKHWSDPEGPIMRSDVIVIDDPQVSCLIPWIRKLNPSVKIIYRSHIEIRADLIRDKPDGPQAQVWNFLWSAIKQADLFISHPVKNFVPDNVPMENVVMMTAATDQLDGLNKPLSDWTMQYYHRVFNRVCYDQGSRKVDWGRPYIVQVARFDPSKGIPDVLEAYRLLCEKFRETQDFGQHDGSEVPQLVICGHGSIDDPDGTVVYEEVHRLSQQRQYRQVEPHITIVRIPPCDQLLNCILRGAIVALQLSHREGFEVKVTEALHKGVPVVAYQAGGIPFQIRDGETGFLVPVGDVEAVADRVYDLCTDMNLRARMSKNAIEKVGEKYFTVANAINWCYLWLKVLEKTRHEEEAPKTDVCLNTDGSTFECAAQLGKTRDPGDIVGNGQWVWDLWRREFGLESDVEGTQAEKGEKAKHLRGGTTEQSE